MEDIQKYTALVNIGELFSGWSHKKSEKIVKPKNEIQDRRKARLKFSRKNSRENTTTDMYHYFIKTSDPIVNSI